MIPLQLHGRDAFRPSNDGTDTDLEDPGGSTAGRARLNGVNHAFAEIERICGWHSILLTAWSGELAKFVPILASPGGESTRSENALIPTV